MAHNVLITGGSGYLGGTLLANLPEANLLPHNKIYALVRNEKQAEAVKQYEVEALNFDLRSEQSIIQGIIDAEISVVFFLISAGSSEVQVSMMKGLAEVKKKTGRQVHLVHTSGAKIFSGHADHPTQKPFNDTDPRVNQLQNQARPTVTFMFNALTANNTIIDTAEVYGVRSYIFIPCIVYGEGEGFGNRISIQTVAIVKVAKALRRVYDINDGVATWPVCHVKDNATLYIELLRQILSEKDLGHGKNGYYLASSGAVNWRDLYAAMAKELAKRKVTDDDEIGTVDEHTVKEMARALKCDEDMVAVQIAGRCVLQADHGNRIGWKPLYPPEHILQEAHEEVDLILRNLDKLNES